MAPRRANDTALREALRPLLGAISVEAMRAANLRASGGGGEAAPNAVARWLWQRVGTNK
jgi:osmoprotectant transport system permease protein